MADNYVQISVRASDQAKPDLDELKAKLQELGREVETAKVDVDDDDAEVKVLRLNAKLAELNAKVANPKISMAGAARAEAEIAAVSLQLDRLKEKADETAAEGAAAGSAGLIGRLFFGTEGAGASLSAAMGPAGVLGVIGALTAALPEIVAVGSGFAAAGAGALAFGALAMPAVKNVETAYTSLDSAQQKYQAAQDKFNADPTKANMSALKTAALNLSLVKQQLDKMPQSEQGAVQGIHDLVTEFGQLSRAFEPQIFNIFDDALEVANILLPSITPFANAFANALHGLLQQVAKFAESKGFQQWLGQFQQLVGPATTAIGVGIGHLVTSFGKLLTIFSAKDVVNGINIAFSILNGTLRTVAGAVEGLKSAWDKVTSYFDGTVRPAFARLASFISQTFSSISGMRPSFAGAEHAVAALTADWVKTFAALPGQLSRIFANAEAWLHPYGVKIFQGLLAGLVAFFPNVMAFMEGRPAAIKGQFSGAGTWLINAGRAIMQGLINGLVSGEPSLLGELAHIATFIAEHKGPIEKDRLLLVPHGQAIMDGLIGGMASRIPNLRGELSNITGVIAGTPGPGGRGAAGSAAGQGVVHLQVTGGGAGLDGLFAAWLKNYVRASGGDPSMFNRKVAFS